MDPTASLDPWVTYRTPPAVAAAAPDDPWAKYREAPVVEEGADVYDPATGVKTPGPKSQPTTTEDVKALKQGLYGNDATGAALAANKHFIGDIPVIGPPLDALTDRAAAGIQTIAGGTPYSDNLAKLQKAETAADAAHPIAATIGGTAGNVAALTAAAPLAPEMFGLDQGATMLRNTLNAARTGGILQGTTAAEKDIPDPNKTWPETAKDIAINTGIGAGLYGSAPMVGAGVGALVGKLAGKSAAAGSPLADEDQRALQWAIEGLKRDNLMSDADIDAAYSAAGPKAFLLEYGPNLYGAANAIGATQSGAKTQIFQGLRARAAQVPQEIENQITGVLGPRQNLADITRSEIAARGQAASPLYNQFRTTTVFPTQGIKDLIAGTGGGMQRIPGFEEMGLLDDANSIAQREATATGQPSPPMQNFFTTGERKTWPTTASFDYIKQAIDDRIASSYKAVPWSPMPQPTNATRQYVMMKNRLDDAVANSNPDAANIWKQARQAWGNPTEIMNARAEGQGVWAKNARRDELQQQINDYTPPQRTAFMEGARDTLAENMDNATRDAITQTGMNNMLTSKAGQDKLKLISKSVTGDEAPAQALIDRLGQIKNENTAKQQITGNSATAAREIALKQMTPDPSQTIVARGLDKYAPHVMPGSYLPFGRMMKEAAAKGQAQQFENSMNAFAPWLMKQGPEAAAFAKALAAHGNAQQSGVQSGVPVGQMVQLLAQGFVPQTTPYAAGTVQNQFQPRPQ